MPSDNPWPNSPVYSMGHRNAQGLACNPDNGDLYATEHGQRNHDEINRIAAGEDRITAGPRWRAMTMVVAPIRPRLRIVAMKHGPPRA
ncbi:PQQ-dependent sugar dehydrogenase [Paenibacillus barcinonensis]|uniref:PQQ-dependent sugar dehydrogenase n=1 Tax=Paenibacillus barcinonensis TaxID=198119 RepID=UPI003CC81792